MNCLTTAAIVESPPKMYSLILYAVDVYTIVTKSVISIADASPPIPIPSRFRSQLERRLPKPTTSPGSEYPVGGDRLKLDELCITQKHDSDHSLAVS